MKVATHTSIVHHHYIEIDGIEYGTTFAANEYIEPKVETEGNKTTITYAAHDECPESPREWGSLSTMVSLRDGLGYGGRNDVTIDEPESEVAMAWKAGERLAHATLDNEIYYLVKCGCWSSHDLEEVAAGECDQPFEALVVGQDDQHFPDGSTYALEFVDDYGFQLDSIEGVAAILAHWSANWRASAADLARAYLSVARPDILALIEWSVQGYSQGDWAEGYAYTTNTDFTDPKAALVSEVEEYKSYFRGDVYMAVRETYIDGQQDDYDCCGGFFGDDYITSTIKNGDF